MEKSKNYRDLVILQKSHYLVLEVYKITKLFPKDELFGLTPQLRRAVISVLQILQKVLPGQVLKINSDFII